MTAEDRIALSIGRLILMVEEKSALVDTLTQEIQGLQAHITELALEKSELERLVPPALSN